MPTFTTPEPITVQINNPAGWVKVETAETTTTELNVTGLNDAGRVAAESATVDFDGRTLVVDIHGRSGLFGRSGSVGIAVRCPTASSVDLSGGSADLTATGRYTMVTARSGSGNVSVGDVTGDANVRTGSGEVDLARCAGAAIVASGSGGVRVGSTGTSTNLTTGSGDAHVEAATGTIVSKTGSGSVRVDDLDGSLASKSGSGNTTIARAVSGDLSITTASGDIIVGVQTGTAVWLDVSSLTGRITQRLDEATAPAEGQRRLTVAANAVTGDITIRRA